MCKGSTFVEAMLLGRCSDWRPSRGMFFKRHMNQLEDMFLAQFEQEGDHLCYRKWGIGAPIPVTIEEREEFRLQYRRSARRLLWSAGLGLPAAVIIGTSISREWINEGLGTTVISLAAVGAIYFVTARGATAPARALKRRTPVGVKRSKEEMQSRHLATTSWTLLGSIFLTSTFIFLTVIERSHFDEWLEFLWAFLSGIISMLSARAMWLKCRLPAKLK